MPGYRGSRQDTVPDLLRGGIGEGLVYGQAADEALETELLECPLVLVEPAAGYSPSAACLRYILEVFCKLWQCEPSLCYLLYGSHVFSSLAVICFMAKTILTEEGTDCHLILLLQSVLHDRNLYRWCLPVPKVPTQRHSGLPESRVFSFSCNWSKQIRNSRQTQFGPLTRMISSNTFSR